jgi:hypothetical protein
VPDPPDRTRVESPRKTTDESRLRRPERTRRTPGSGRPELAQNGTDVSCRSVERTGATVVGRAVRSSSWLPRAEVDLGHGVGNGHCVLDGADEAEAGDDKSPAAEPALRESRSQFELDHPGREA